MTFWFKLSSFLLPQGLPGMPGGVGQPGSVGEKVRIFSLATTRLVWAHVPVCVCVFILLNVTSLSGWGWRSWRPWDSWRAWHCCESRCLHLPFLSCSTSSFLRCLSSPFHQLSFHMCSRVLTAIWGRRVTLALPEQLGLQDPEEHQGRMDPKATLWVSLNQWLFLVNVMQCGWWFLTHWFYHRAPLDSLEIQDPLENLASMWVFLLLLLFYYSWIVG